jgi:hypothetical protein
VFDVESLLAIVGPLNLLEKESLCLWRGGRAGWLIGDASEAGTGV